MNMKPFFGIFSYDTGYDIYVDGYGQMTIFH